MSSENAYHQENGEGHFDNHVQIDNTSSGEITGVSVEGGVNSHNNTSEQSGLEKSSDNTQQSESGEHQLSQLLERHISVPKQESNLSIDDIDKMISESIRQGNDIPNSEYTEGIEKRRRDEAEELEGNDVHKRQRQVVEEQNVDNSKTAEELELEFEKAIEDHHRESSAPPAEISQVNSEETAELQMIANELQEATGAGGRKDPAQQQLHHDQQQQQLQHKQQQQPQQGQQQQPEAQLQQQVTLQGPHQDKQQQSHTVQHSHSHQTQLQHQHKPPQQDGSEIVAHEQVPAANYLVEQKKDQSAHVTPLQKDQSNDQTSDPSQQEHQPGHDQKQKQQSVEQHERQQEQNDPVSTTRQDNSRDNHTEQPNQNEQSKPQSAGVVVHEGLSVPADSELLNTNTALAAYNALSSQLPPLATLASAHLAALPLPIASPDFLPPRIQLLINTLPTLDNLASQLLRIVAIGPYQKILDLVAQPDTPAGATYRDLTSLFEFTKKLYSEEDPFLSVEHLAPGIWKSGEKTPSMFRNREQSIESTLRKVNLATFLGATLGTLEVGFFYLNESFLEIFCPANNLDPENALSNMSFNNMSLQGGLNTAIGDTVGKLMKPQAVLYLDLKTQAYISAIEAGERSREDILEDILPTNIEEVLLHRRGTKTLTPTELDFSDRCKTRKENLLNYPPDKDLSEEYEWLSFLKELFEYSSKNMGFLIWGKKGRMTRERNIGDTTRLSNVDHMSSRTPHSQELLTSDEKARQEEAEVERQRVQEAIRSHDIDDIARSLLPSEIQEQQIHLRINPLSNVRNLSRRPWTRDEEKALRHALELKGPQWATILELFGAGGKISEALKNRTQVQLKDKARNWKMFFLKSGLPVPAYLMKVTGDLEREDKSKSKVSKMSKKTAAAPVPSPIAKVQKST
ncbi:transcription factor Tbf1p [[Candida] anglica]|uniref:Transcription factor Tbf1p n=1 Tax=[Candida] anglica TaxID=148631 RepID=A0ABP0EJ53_9ASCO